MTSTGPSRTRHGLGTTTSRPAAGHEVRRKACISSPQGSADHRSRETLDPLPAVVRASSLEPGLVPLGSRHRRTVGDDRLPPPAQARRRAIDAPTGGVSVPAACSPPPPAARNDPPLTDLQAASL